MISLACCWRSRAREQSWFLSYAIRFISVEFMKGTYSSAFDFFSSLALTWSCRRTFFAEVLFSYFTLGKQGQGRMLETKRETRRPADAAAPFVTISVEQGGWAKNEHCFLSCMFKRSIRCPILNQPSVLGSFFFVMLSAFSWISSKGPWTPCTPELTLWNVNSSRRFSQLWDH